MTTGSVETHDVKKRLEDKLSNYFGVSPQDASIDQIYKAVSMTVVDILLEKKKQYNRKVKEQKAKRIYYLCMEFLVGKTLRNNLRNLGLYDTMESLLWDM